MTRFFSKRYGDIVPYVPGEQPKKQTFIKLNTNESPFPPSKNAIRMASEVIEGLRLYSDPECTALKEAASRVFGVPTSCLLPTNGSDEILYFAFLAFCDDAHPARFPDITYGFYPVFAKTACVPAEIIPLKADFTIDPADYAVKGRTVFIANPNAPTGIALSRDTIEKLVKENPDTLYVVDEAYVDFGGESCMPLTQKYDNILVTMTFSKSRSLAGGRLGFGIACPALIDALRAIKDSVNPYNVNAMTMAAGIGSLSDEAYTKENCENIIASRTRLTEGMRALGFFVTDSHANFVFARHERLGGEEVFLALRERGFLVRHFSSERIKDFNRITVGTAKDTEALLSALADIVNQKENKS